MTDPAVADLYGLEPEQFVPARTALARALRTGGDRALAAEVAKLRRPSASAWALNQVARREPGLIGSFLAAAAALSGALADPADVDVRAAQRAFRAEIEVVVRTALDIVTTSGRSASTALQQAVQATLQAAAVDDGIADALRAGVLAGDAAAPGFLVDASTVAVSAETGSAETGSAVRAGGSSQGSPARSRRPAPPSAAPLPSAPRGPSFEERRLAKEQQRAAAAERTRLRAEVAKLTTDAERLERRAARLERIAADAEEAARTKRAEAEEARRDAEQARADRDAHPAADS